MFRNGVAYDLKLSAILRAPNINHKGTPPREETESYGPYYDDGSKPLPKYLEDASVVFKTTHLRANLKSLSDLR